MNTAKITAFIAMIFILPAGISGYFVGNVPCDIVIPACTEGGNKESGPSFHFLVVRAGASFLQSNGDYQGLLNIVELSTQKGISIEILTAAIDEAIVNMELAHGLYAEIYDLSLKSEFNPVILEKLKAFNYKDYQSKNQLNPLIFNQVALLLKAGKIPDIYLTFYRNSGDVLAQLKEARQSLSSTPTVQLSQYWRINRGYMNLAMFGQYVSEVLLSLK